MGGGGLRPGHGFHISTTPIGCRVEDSGFGVWVLGCRVRALYGRHALPMLELYREKKGRLARRRRQQSCRGKLRSIC